MSFKMRMEELSQKVATARINPGSMEDRLEEHRLARMGERGANARDYLSTNLRGVDDGRCRVEEKLILMKLRAVSEEVKLAAARLGRKNVIQGFQKHALDTMVSKQQRREEMKTLADRARAQAHYDSIARVLLPAILAAARVSVFARILKRSRYVLSKAKQGTAACIKIQRMFKWRTWRSWFTRGMALVNFAMVPERALHWRQWFKRHMAMKKFLRKNLWVVWLDFRIRRKGVAVGVLATSVREYSARVPAVALLRKYKYKIRMAQTQIRRTMTAKNGQILSVMRQWSLFLMAQCTPMPDGKKKRRMKKTAVFG
ncbi:hypothetical protein T484DRAFT_1859749 [Baffinella frigidus]|nr:hypothetical protein T484DRAFT_1859749 [Cryptophyta sp. CCMP2293]